MIQSRPWWLFLPSSTWIKCKHYKVDQSEPGQSLSHLAAAVGPEDLQELSEDSSLEGEGDGEALLGFGPSSAGLSCRL